MFDFYKHDNSIMRFSVTTGYSGISSEKLSRLITKSTRHKNAENWKTHTNNLNQHWIYSPIMQTNKKQNTNSIIHVKT